MKFRVYIGWKFIPLECNLLNNVRFGLSDDLLNYF